MAQTDIQARLFYSEGARKYVFLRIDVCWLSGEVQRVARMNAFYPYYDVLIFYIKALLRKNNPFFMVASTSIDILSCNHMRFHPKSFVFAQMNIIFGDEKHFIIVLFNPVTNTYPSASGYPLKACRQYTSGQPTYPQKSYPLN